MKIAAYSILASTSVIGIAEVIPVSGAVQWGAFGVLAWTVWYLLARSMPASARAQREERKVFVDAQKDARKDFTDGLSGLARSLDLMAVSISGARRPPESPQEASQRPPEG